MKAVLLKNNVPLTLSLQLVRQYPFSILLLVESVSVTVNVTANGVAVKTCVSVTCSVSVIVILMVVVSVTVSIIVLINGFVVLGVGRMTDFTGIQKHYYHIKIITSRETVL